MEHYFTNNADLKSEIRKINYTYDSSSFIFYSDLGVFSKDKIDYGSKLLVETYLNKHKDKRKVLDIGCGYGFIGIIISKITDSKVLLSDVNKRALHLAKRNIDNLSLKCDVILSDAYQCIDEKFDTIITNPPIRVGKEKVLEILKEGKDYLNKDGELWYVIRKDQGVKSINKLLENYYKIEIVTKSKGFYVVKATIK